MPEINWTFTIGDLLTIGILPFLYRGFTLLLSQRDFNLEVTRLLKGENGNNGLVSITKKLQHDVYESGGRVSKLSHYIVRLRLALAGRDIVTPDPE